MSLPLSWDPPGLSTWMAGVKDVDRWLFKDVMPLEANILLTGKPKQSYKSYMTMAMSLSLATGRPLMSINGVDLIPANPEGVPVLFLEAEAVSVDTKNRFMRLCKSYDIDPDSLDEKFKWAFRDEVYLDKKNDLGVIMDYVAQKGIKFLVIDPLFNFMSTGDENDSNAMRPLLRSLGNLRKEHGVTNLIIHHTKKGPEHDHKDFYYNIDEAIRGSSALAGYYDQHWGFFKRRPDQEHLDLIVRSKDLPEREMRVKWHISSDAGTARFDLTEPTEAQEMQEGTQDLKDNIYPGTSATMKRLQEMLCCTKERIENLVAASISEGWLEEVEPGKYRRIK